MGASFIKGIRGTDPITNDGHSQVAFLGRSNVGKSSVINSLLGTKSLVRSSSTPGQTREINFFLVSAKKENAKNEEIYFVDLPGYGYARMSMKSREKMAKMILWYLTESGADIGTAVLILDMQRGMSDFDRDMLEVLRAQKYKTIVVANKSDKLNQKERHAAEENIRAELSGEELILYSAKKGRGREKLIESVM